MEWKKTIKKGIENVSRVTRDSLVGNIRRIYDDWSKDTHKKGKKRIYDKKGN